MGRGLGLELKQDQSTEDKLHWKSKIKDQIGEYKAIKDEGETLISLIKL